MIRQANRQDIEELSILRVEHQKAEGKEDYHCDDTELQNKAEAYFSKHLKLYRNFGFFENKNAMKAKL